MSVVYLLLLFVLLLVFIIFVVFLVRQIIFATAMLHGAFFIASKDDKLASMIKLAKPKKGEKIIDLGSGDGKIVIKLAKMGYKSEGVEINPILVKNLRKRIRFLRLEKMIKVKRDNFWNLDLSGYDLIFLYGTTYIMKRLEKKMLSELKPGSRVVSNHFQFPNWIAEKSENDVRIYRK